MYATCAEDAGAFGLFSELHRRACDRPEVSGAPPPGGGFRVECPTQAHKYTHPAWAPSKRTVSAGGTFKGHALKVSTRARGYGQNSKGLLLGAL